MATTKYLDYQGLQYLWNKIKKYVGDGIGSIFAWQKITGTDAADPTSTTTFTADAGSDTLQFVDGANIQTTIAKDTNSGAIKVTTMAKDVVTNVALCKGFLKQTVNGSATNIATAAAIVDAGKTLVVTVGEGGTTGSGISKCMAFNSFQVDRDFARKSEVKVSDYGVMLCFDTCQEIATIGSTPIHVRMPSYPNTDTKNTAGSTNDSGCLFIVGAKSQGANPQTYSNKSAYVKAGKVYSDGIETVSLTATQTLTNKTLTNAKASSNPASTCASTSLATTKYVTDAVAAAAVGAVHFKGSVAPTNYNTVISDYKTGWYWLVQTAGSFGALGELQAGDQIYAIDDASAFNVSTLTVVQANLDPMSSSEIDAATDQTPNAV